MGIGYPNCTSDGRLRLSQAYARIVDVSIFDLCFHASRTHLANGHGPPMCASALSSMTITGGRLLPSR